MFKLKDPKIDRLRTGLLSVEAFSLLITPDDPYVLIGDTIYALTEVEYYASRPVIPNRNIAEAAANHILSMEDLSFMTSEDRDKVGKVKAEMAGKCSGCAYKKYKEELYRLSKKYSIELPSTGLSGLLAGMSAELHIADYPDTTEDVQSKVRDRLAHVFKVPKQGRIACLNCVEKHLAQAYVIGLEALQGYPEYVYLVIGHLSEALDELPGELTELKQTLEFCVARTKYTRKPFVPLQLLIPLLEFARSESDKGVDAPPVPENLTDADESVLALSITDAIPDELARAWMVSPEFCRRAGKILRDCEDFILQVENSNSEMARITWQGSVGQAADLLATIAPGTSAILRNRRLLFAGAPRLSVESGYGMSDIVRMLEGS